MRKKSRNLCRHGVVGKNDWFWQSKVSFGKRRTNDLIVSMCVACYNKEADNFEVYGGIYMVGKMTKNEKILASLSLAVLVIAIIVKCFIGTTDTGVLVMLSFTGILMWLIILFCAFFPAEWRMTEKQKSKIENHTEYQNKYRKIFIGIDTVIAILFSVLILLSK